MNLKLNKIIPLLLLPFIFITACQKQYIPNTEIPDNNFNRDVINFCERYRHAVEDLNVGVLLNLASPRYFDNSGTVSGDDDVNKQHLEEILGERFKSIDEIRYEIKYRSVFEDESAIIVQIIYTMSFQFTIDGETRWHNYTGDKRINLERDGNSFLILSGM
ncbi:MAG: hypothetical protein JXR91_07885 [Deltaproteobacteria bacterium]|nr:hypothetical protein [Deltaproteobacteria bacterium]